MPRPAEFDRNEVLQAAMSVFWTYGYEASSISRLLDKMQINRGSLYAAFGDKDGLFREVMTVYVRFLSDVISTLKKTENPMTAIESFFEEAFLDQDAEALPKGCLLFNTVSELNLRRPDLAGEAMSHLGGIRDIFVARLEQAEDQGLLPEGADPQSMADGLVALLSGFRVLCQMGADEVRIKAALNLTLPKILHQQPYC